MFSHCELLRLARRQIDRRGLGEIDAARFDVLASGAIDEDADRAGRGQSQAHWSPRKMFRFERNPFEIVRDDGDVRAELLAGLLRGRERGSESGREHLAFGSARDRTPDIRAAAAADSTDCYGNTGDRIAGAIDDLNGDRASGIERVAMRAQRRSVGRCGDR